MVVRDFRNGLTGNAISLDLVSGVTVAGAEEALVRALQANTTEPLDASNVRLVSESGQSLGPAELLPDGPHTYIVLQDYQERINGLPLRHPHGDVKEVQILQEFVVRLVRNASGGDEALPRISRLIDAIEKYVESIPPEAERWGGPNTPGPRPP